MKALYRITGSWGRGWWAMLLEIGYPSNYEGYFGLAAYFSCHVRQNMGWITFSIKKYSQWLSIRVYEVIGKKMQVKVPWNPTNRDIERIEANFRDVGFLGCIGAIDCAGWDWDSAPEKWHFSTMKDGKKPCMRLQAVCDMEVCVWS